MGKSSVIVISCLFLFLCASCQNETTTQNEEVPSSSSSFTDIETTNSTQSEVLGNSKKDHSQQMTQITSQQSVEIPAGNSTDTSTNQAADTTGSTYTFWTRTHAELLTIQQPTSEDNSTEQSTVDSTEESPVSSTERFIVSSTEQSTVSSTERSIVSSTEQSTVSSTERSIVSSTEQSTVSSTERSIVSSTEQSTVSSTERSIVSSTEQSTVGSTERSIVSSTEQSTVSSTERSIVSSTEQSTVNSTDQHINTTQISKEESTEAVHETSTESSSPDTSTKESSDKSTLGVTYSFTNSTERNSSEHSTEWEGGTSTEQTTMQRTDTPTVPATQEAGNTSSLHVVTSYLTTTSSEMYTPATATNISIDLTTLPVTEQFTEPTTALQYTEQSTEPTTASPYTEQSTEPVTASSYTEQSTEPTTASPYTEETTEYTNASSYTEQSTEYTNASSYTEETTEYTNTSSYTEQTTNEQNITDLPIEWSSETTRPLNETVAGYNDESSDDWKIAVGVVIPLSLLISVLVGVYICYRKKYPVRMIIGREFGKFSNPNYQRRGHVPSLIREDADFFFSNNRTSTSVPSQEFNPVNKKIMYDNMGFVRDENNDEEEQERKFLQSKSWLFKNASEESKTSAEEDAESSFIANSPTDEGSKLDANRNETKKSKGAIKAKAVVAGETTPVVMPRRKKKAPQPPANKEPFSELKNEPNGQPATLEVTSEIRIDVSKNAGSSLPRNFGLPVFTRTETQKDTDSNGEITTDVKLGVQLSQETPLNQQIKERSRSLSLDPIQLDGRQRSFSVEQPSSSRKMSLYDEIVEATRLRFLAAQKMTSSIFEGVSPVTAFVVGVDFRDRDASVTSSVLTADDDSTHEEQTNFEDVYPQKPKRTKQYHVKKFDEDKYTPALDETDHYNVPIPHNLLSDRKYEEENHESKSRPGSQIQDNVKSTDVVTLSDALEDRSYHDDTEAAFPGAFSSSNIDQYQVGMPERRTSSDSGSSTSSSNNEGIKKDFLNTTPTSGLEISAIKKTNSDTEDAEVIEVSREIAKTFRSEDGNDQRVQENDLNEDGSNDVHYDANTSSADDRRRKFQHMSPEMKHSSSSTESVAGSSKSSHSIPSDSEEEDLDMYFPASIETPNKNVDNASNDEQIVSSRSIIEQPLSRLHQGDDVHDHTLPISAGADSSQKVVFHFQYSDSSSDSSDISPRKAITLLSRERQDSDSVEESVHSPEVTSDRDHMGIASQEQLEDGPSPEEGATYKFLDFIDDGDVDV